MYDKNSKKLNFNIKLSLEEARKLLTYFDDEFMESFDEFLGTLEEGKNDDNEDFQYYDDLRTILEDLVYDLHKEIRKKERTDEKNKDDDELEKDSIKKKLSPYSLEILKKIQEADRNLYPPLLYRMYWYLHSSFDKSGQLIFTQHSLEDLLELDRYKLEKFLEHLSNIEVKIGNHKGKMIEGYKFLNSTTVKINYNIHIVNPHTAVVRDKDFKIEGLDKISAQMI